jgi:nucleoside-diphosphate-sugar epimerase
MALFVKILVTGSSGHLGEALMRVQAADGYDVVGLDVLGSPYTNVVGRSLIVPACASAWRVWTRSSTPRRSPSPTSTPIAGRTSWTRT